MKQCDFTNGNITSKLMAFALPMIAGNILQQCYNIADTLIVGRWLGRDALAAVGSSFSLMTFITSIILGLCMGSGVAFSISYGEGDVHKLKSDILHSFILIFPAALLINVVAVLGLDPIMTLLRVPDEVVPYMREYLQVIFVGIIATFLYNYFASLLRAVGNSVAPLIFLGVSALLNVGLDLLFILAFDMGVGGAAWATVIAQYVSGIGAAVYTLAAFPEYRISRGETTFDSAKLKGIAGLSFMTSVQQSVMNFGILMVQGLVNSFGAVIMAAFAAGVKIDSFAYMPVQDFGNAFSTFIAQNYGAGKTERIKKGIRGAVICVSVFCVAVSALIFVLAPMLIGIFVEPTETEIIAEGARYLRVEGVLYIGIGILFLLYGYYRAVKRPGMSVILTVCSLGTRVALAYILSAIPSLGVVGIWVSVPIGWAFADIVGAVYYRYLSRRERTL
ncbi:MAG TPA: MATE family efflux transporter [Firmicutes bacterium]|nr:MATE family efflux transporter [Bacillota bacterium]